MFYREQTKPLVAFLIQQGANLHDAADAAQEGMTAAWRNWAEIEHPRAWVQKVASRALIRRRVDDQKSSVDTQLVRDTDTSAWDLSLDLQRALPCLTERQRQVMAWHLGGYTGPEIAVGLALSEDAVRQHLYQARKALRTWLCRKGGSS